MGRGGPFTDCRSCSCSAARIARIGVSLQQQRARFRRHVVRLAPTGVNFILHNARRWASAVLLHRRRLLPLWSPPSPPRRLDCDGCGCPQHSARWSGKSALRSARSAHRLKTLQSSVALSLARRLTLASRLFAICNGFATVSQLIHRQFLRPAARADAHPAGFPPPPPHSHTAQ